MGWWNKLARDKMKEDVLKEIDPAKREWEYDGDGTKIYKLEAGYTGKTLYPKKSEKK